MKWKVMEEGLGVPKESGLLMAFCALLWYHPGQRWQNIGFAFLIFNM